MYVTLLKCKIHRATVSDCDLDYEGSISIDKDLMEAAGLLPFEQVDVLNITNGERLTTYVIEAEAASGTIGLNGAAARKAVTGDKVIIVAYAAMKEMRAKEFVPRVVFVDDDNRAVVG